MRLSARIQTARMNAGGTRVEPLGERVLDEEGFWRNEMLMPDRSNWVTKLYDELELQGLIHHVSGAVITDRVLGEYGCEALYREAVAD